MKKILLIVILSITWISSSAQMSDICNGIKKIVADKNLKIGVAILDLTNQDTLSINGKDRFPMQSVFKLHLAIAVLNEVDKGKLNLKDSIYFDKSELYSHLWSPIQKAYPEGGVKLPLSEVIKYTIQQSDNSGCDKLLKLIGGPQQVNNYIHGIGIDQFNVENNEFQLQSSWDKQFNNWTTPLAAIELLKKINEKSLLKEDSQNFLWQTMLSTSTGSIRKNLPADAQVAYKTGFSGQNDKGETAANNNVGIIILPDNNKIAYAIFITDSKENQDVNYSMIAEIGNLIFNSTKVCK